MLQADSVYVCVCSCAWLCEHSGHWWQGCDPPLEPPPSADFPVELPLPFHSLCCFRPPFVSRVFFFVFFFSLSLQAAGHFSSAASIPTHLQDCRVCPGGLQQVENTNEWKGERQFWCRRAQSWSNFGLHSESFFLTPDEYESSVHSTFTSVLVSTN